MVGARPESVSRRTHRGPNLPGEIAPVAAASVWILDETSSRKPLQEFRLELASERLTAAELIRRRVQAEVERWNRAPTGVHQGLVQPAGSERTGNGFRFAKPRHIDVAAQERMAVEAFGRNGFLLLVNDRQVRDLDEEIVVTPDLRVRFVKLVPLVGG
jgi:hypothetical protein